ncbi:ABC transporter substrate-binding protein [Neomegalonema sp.]|uniref:ABC transporter substrate-binding protein n=1 Tax=Neomegalonema sp. TaxID=2039713 RepID=UPI00262DE091|nr:ABC transporter substrate-binding protein [Neomegalonema sp.]MDD2867805.1 ABC transporter substrate-binding protein [Neomegalonema sp.]
MRLFSGAAMFAVFLAQAAAADPPGRVLSMNLCTDQLAMLVAAPGQLISVSYLAQDPGSSPMAEAAMAYATNYGRAEDIVVLQPDLVLAGRYTTLATVALLERLGIPVVRFEPENSLDDVTRALRRMGDLLGRRPEAEARIARFEADRARIALRAAALPRERAATYAANGYTGGKAGLSAQILDLAGLDNIAGELGLPSGGRIALESLILAAPDHLVLGRRHPGWSEAQALLDHPALRGLPSYARGTPMADRDWVCGTPHVLAAVGALLDAREAEATR